MRRKALGLAIAGSTLGLVGSIGMLVLDRKNKELEKEVQIKNEVIAKLNKDVLNKNKTINELIESKNNEIDEFLRGSIELVTETIKDFKKNDNEEEK